MRHDPPPPSPRPVAPRVSAVVVNHDGGDKLLTCLCALYRQTLAPLEVFVVDSGSTDGSPAAARRCFPAARLIELGGNRGPAVSRNAGLQAATGDVVVFIDNDVYPMPHCLARLLEGLHSTAASAVCPRIRLVPELDTVQCDGAWVHFTGTMRLHHGYRPADVLPQAGYIPVGCAITACLLVDRRAARAVGGFDPSFFMYFEDLEFGLRLRAQGHALVCATSAVACHERGRGTPGLSFRGRGRYPRRRAYYTMRNRLLTVLLHYRCKTMGVLLPPLVLFEGASLVMALQRGWVGMWVRAWGWLWRHRRDIACRRQRIQAARRRSDRQLLSGGPVPLAPGLLQARSQRRLAGVFSALLDTYWRWTKSRIG